MQLTKDRANQFVNEGTLDSNMPLNADFIAQLTDKELAKLIGMENIKNGIVNLQLLLYGQADETAMHLLSMRLVNLYAAASYTTIAVLPEEVAIPPEQTASLYIFSLEGGHEVITSSGKIRLNILSTGRYDERFYFVSGKRVLPYSNPYWRYQEKRDDYGLLVWKGIENTLLNKPPAVIRSLLLSEEENLARQSVFVGCCLATVITGAATVLAARRKKQRNTS